MTVIVVTVAIPIISDNQLAESGEDAVANASAINSMINIIPLLLIVAVIIAIVGMFLYNRSKA